MMMMMMMMMVMMMVMPTMVMMICPEMLFHTSECCTAEPWVCRNSSSARTITVPSLHPPASSSSPMPISGSRGGRARQSRRPSAHVRPLRRGRRCVSASLRSVPLWWRSDVCGPRLPQAMGWPVMATQTAWIPQPERLFVAWTTHISRGKHEPATRGCGA